MQTSDSGGAVLVVDDEDVVRRVFAMILSDALQDHRVDTATNGAEAVEAFARHRYRVLLMDLHMPVMDGAAAFDAIERLCFDRRWEMPRVVFCTGFSPPASLRASIEKSDVHAVLTKPVSSDVLVDAVQSRLT